MMNTKFFLLLLLFMSASSVFTIGRAKEKAKHVIFIGLDGELIVYPKLTCLLSSK